jgi:CDP-4-dehydro-6-deoxyglucose reductase, E3
VPSVTLKSGTSFPVNDGETILDAALRAGLSVEHSCKIGRCASCKTRVVAGTTVTLQQEAELLPQEIDAGWILTCCRTAANDVTLATAEITQPLPPSRIVPAKISELLRLSSDILKVCLRLPPQQPLAWLAGQYVELATGGGLKRSYSVANAPGAAGRLEFLIRRVDGGEMSRYWFDEAEVGDLLRVHGPKGTFFLREPRLARLIFLATGTGIAPVQAMLTSLASQIKAPPPRVTVLWGNRLEQDLVADPGRWFPGIEYIPVLSRPADGWNGARGHIQSQFQVLGSEFGNAMVYACGSASMIAECRTLLLAAGLPEDQFLADAFVCSAATELA